MSEENKNRDISQVHIKENEDGTKKRVVVKKVIKKVVLKTKKKEDFNSKPKISKKGLPQKKLNQVETQKNTYIKQPSNFNKPKVSEKKDENSKPSHLEKKKIFITRKKQNKNYTDKSLEEQKSEKFYQFNKKKKEFKQVDELANIPSSIEISETISIKDLSHKLNIKSTQIIKKFFSLGIMDITVNDIIDSDTAKTVCKEFKCKVTVVSLSEQTKVDFEKGDEKNYKPRSPVVTIMGHVDHGKTSLLDAIRNTNIAKKEIGGITQHIGAFRVDIKKGSILFIDTPGHAAFSAMRARGTKVTDIVILVVSATDGVMPQTIESINLAKNSNTPIIIAINKCDLESADPEKTKSQIAEHGLVPEEWGGDIIFHNVSAHTKSGIPELLESILLLSEISELKHSSQVKGNGYVLESRLVMGKGNVATIIIRNGNVKRGDSYLCGIYSGKIRTIFDDKGATIKSADSSTPIEIIGLSGLPNSGDIFQIMENEKESKRIADMRVELHRQTAAQKTKKVNIDNLFDTIASNQTQELKVIVKADVYGSTEAIKEVISTLKNKEIKVNVVSSDTGEINENDVNFASAIDAEILGFRVKSSNKAKKLSEKEQVHITYYTIIYDIIDYLKEKLRNMLPKEISYKVIGSAEVKEIFKISGTGKIAGCIVMKGKIKKPSLIKIIRENETIQEADIKMLKHYKDEVSEISSGQECGVQIDNFELMKVGDTLECIEVIEKKRELILDE